MGWKRKKICDRSWNRGNMHWSPPRAMLSGGDKTTEEGMPVKSKLAIKLQQLGPVVDSFIN